MPTKVLVFESDAAFAGELRNELGRLGMVAQVVDDGYAGLMAAASERPDLILLSIELPRMNGFSVCNKLKKDPALKDVPLIIMSTDSSEETFDQHRKLRTRAEDYVRKPIAFGELLEHMRPFVKMDQNGHASVRPDEDAIIIDDDIELDGVEAVSAEESAAEAARVSNVEEEVEAFANTAFDRLMDSEPPTSTHSSRAPAGEAPAAELEGVVTSAARISSAPPVQAKKSSRPPKSVPDAEVERLRADAEQLRADAEQQKAEIARMERELGNARSEISRLEEASKQVSADDERVVKLQRELDELKLKAASGGKVAGVSSREFLDLREGLNKKEKEILGLRDQLTRKEKELLDASDTTLALERDKADLEDKIGGLERDLAAAKAAADTAKADKDQAAKRADDFKTRGEKVKAELEAKTAELAGIAKKHEDELAEFTKRHAEQIAEITRSHEAQIAELTRGRDEQIAELTRAREEQIAELTRGRDEQIAELTRAREEQIAEITRRHEEGIAERDAALATTKEQAQRDAETAATSARENFEAAQKAAEEKLKSSLDELRETQTREREEALTRRAELAETDKSAALEAQRNDYEARIASMVQSHEDDQRRLNERVAELSGDLSARIEEREELARELPKTKAQLAAAESQLAATKAELADIRDKLSQHTQRLDTATSKWDQNRRTLDQAKDALAAALAQIEEAESRGLD